MNPRLRLWFRRSLAMTSLVCSIAYFSSSVRGFGVAAMILLTGYLLNELGGPHERPF